MILKALAAAAALFAAHAAAADANAAPLDFAAMQRLDGRIATVGHRLAVANVALCRDQVWRHGIVFLDLAKVAPDARAAALRAFGTDSGLGVMALAAGGPAERARLRSGDVILALDGRPPPSLAPEEEAAARMDRIFAAIDAAFADGRAELALGRGAERLVLVVAAERACASRFQAVRLGGRRARADGRYVDVSTGLIEFVADDAELAAVVAHEFAHNVLRHRERLDTANVSRGLFSGFGANARRIRETEIEADRLSVYLMEKAGYDPEAAIRFWRRFGPGPLNFLRDGTHPSWQARVRSLEAEIAAIRAARAAGRAPVPPVRAAD